MADLTPPILADVVPVLSDGTVTLRPHQRDDLHRSWAIERQLDDGSARHCGHIDLAPARAGGTAVLGYGLLPDARGQGTMAHAIRLVCRHAFDDLGLGRVGWEAAVGSWAARRVAWRCGFTMHGVLPGGLSDLQGRPVDAWLATLTAGEPLEARTPWLEPVPLEGDGVRLRPWREDDGRFTEPMADPAHYMPAQAAPTPETHLGWLEVRRERMASGTGVFWCIADPGSDRPLGSVMLFSAQGPIGPPTAELGYFLFPRARGRGAVREAVRMVARHAFDPAGLALTRLSAVTAPDNAPSNAVLAALGFARWGTEHESYTLPDGGTGGALHWELLAPSRFR